MSQYFPKPYEPFGGGTNVKVDLSNYATKADAKNITYIDTSSFALETNLANLKTEVDKLDIDKLVPVPADLSKLSNVVNNEVVKKTEYDNLANKLNNVDTSRFILKTKYDADKQELEKKIPDTSNLATKAALTTIESKIPNISNLATKAALNTIENKISDVSNLVKKQIITQRLLKLKIKLLIINTMNT